MFSRNKKWKKLCALIAATFITGGIVSPNESFATTMSGGGGNWSGVSQDIQGGLLNDGGVMVSGSDTAMYKSSSFGAARAEAICDVTPKEVEVGQRYTAQCEYIPSWGGYTVPPVVRKSGTAKKGVNTVTMTPGAVIKIRHGVWYVGEVHAKVSFMAYEGASGLGDFADDYGGIGTIGEGLDGDPSYSVYGGNDDDSGDNGSCYYGVCDDKYGGDNGDGDGNTIEKGAEDAFSETGNNSWGASDGDWTSSSGGSEGSSDLGDYFGNGDSDSSGTNPWNGDEYDSGSGFGTIDDITSDGDSSSTGIDTDGDGIIDGWDTDGDGQIDAWDTDGDGVADAWDTNGDGIADAWDTNGDGRPDAWDTDGDGIPDAWDTDGDGIPDAWDTDGDGIADKFAGDGEYTDADVDGFDDGMFGSLYKNLFGGDGKGNSLLGNISNFLGGLSDSLLGGEAKTISDAEMYDIAHGLLGKLGYSDSDIMNGKNYDDGSAYTDPKKAWDMNRITTLMSKHRLKIGTDGNAVKPGTADMKRVPSKKQVVNTQGGAISKAVKDATKNTTHDATVGNNDQKKEEKTPEQIEEENRQAENLLKEAGMPDNDADKGEWAKSVIESLPADQQEKILSSMSEEEKQAVGIQ